MKFTVVYSKRTGNIIREIWEPRKRLFWPLPWMKLPGNPKFDSPGELSEWFSQNYPGENLEYSYYGESETYED